MPLTNLPSWAAVRHPDWADPAKVSPNYEELRRAVQRQDAMQMGVTGTYSATEKISMRMGIPRNGTHPFAFLDVYVGKLGTPYVIVAVAEGPPVVIEDDPHLFPSDKLIGKLNTLRP